MRKSALLSLVAMLALGVAACGGDDDGAAAEGGDEKVVIYANAFSKEVPFFRDLHEGIKLRAKELGWEVVSEFGNGTPEQQVEQIENATTRQPDVMLLTPVNPTALEPPIRRASEAGITVAAVGNSIEDRSILLTSMLFDNEDIGRNKAQFIVDQLGGRGKVAVVHAVRGLTFSEGQRRGEEEVFGQSPDIDVVARTFAGGVSADVGLRETQNILTRTPDVDAIFYDSDDLAAGGIRALKERNVSLDDVLMVGFDGAEPGLRAVRRGELDYTLSGCGVANGILSVDVIRDFMENEKKPPGLVEYRVEAFTPDNIEEKLQELDRRDCR